MRHESTYRAARRNAARGTVWEIEGVHLDPVNCRPTNIYRPGGAARMRISGTPKKRGGRFSHWAPTPFAASNISLSQAIHAIMHSGRLGGRGI